MRHMWKGSADKYRLQSVAKGFPGRSVVRASAPTTTCSATWLLRCWITTSRAALLRVWRAPRHTEVSRDRYCYAPAVIARLRRGSTIASSKRSRSRPPVELVETSGSRRLDQRDASGSRQARSAKRPLGRANSTLDQRTNPCRSSLSRPLCGSRQARSAGRRGSRQARSAVTRADLDRLDQRYGARISTGSISGAAVRISTASPEISETHQTPRGTLARSASRAVRRDR